MKNIYQLPFALVFLAIMLQKGEAQTQSVCLSWNPANCSQTTPPPVITPPPAGSCQPSSSLTVLVQGTNVTAYVPKGNWGSATTGIAVVNVEGTSITPTLISTPKVVNSCASNPLTGQTVCTSNNEQVYVLSGTSLLTTLFSGALKPEISFSGGSCVNCGVAMDAPHNRAVLGLSVSGVPGYQFLDLATLTFEPAFASASGNPSLGTQPDISEDILIDPSRNLLLSPAENNNFEIVNIQSSTAPGFFELNPIAFSPGGIADSAAEDCTTGIALATAEFSNPSEIFIADLTQATFTAPKASGAAGTWSAPSQVQTLLGSHLEAGPCGIAVAQGTHTGIVSGEFGGNEITAIALPTTSGPGTGVPAITDWISCGIPGFTLGDDPHTVTAYQSPNGANDPIALISNLHNGGTATRLAVIDLKLMLDPAIVPRTTGGHACLGGTLPASVATFVAVPSAVSD